MISDFSYSRHEAMLSTLLAERSISFVTLGFGLWTKASMYNKLTGTYTFSNPKDTGGGNINELSNTVNYFNLGLNLSLTAKVYKSPTYSLAFFYNVSRSFFNEFDIAVSTIFMQHTVGFRYRMTNSLNSNTSP